MNNLIILPKFVLQLLLGWFIALPLAFLIKKQRNLISFIGRDNGIFTDNVKYFFLFLHNLKPDGIEYYFITEDRATYLKLKKLYLPVLIYPSFKTIYILLKSNILVVDNWTWITNIKYHFLHRAKKIQIWHGVPLKKIELDTSIEFRKGNLTLIKLRNIFGFRFPNYDSVVSTSKFISQISFSNAFKTKNIIHSGYPRNDIFLNKINDLYLVGVDNENYNKILELKNEGFKIILYTPTFRDTGGDALNDGVIDLNILKRFAKDNGLLFVFKFHPNPDLEYLLKNNEQIVVIHHSKDIYPLLPLSDMMITDYSSIYFDYLLLNKPIIFFPYDINKYLANDRELYFEYDEFTPGPKVMNQTQLQTEIIKLLNNTKENYSKQKKEILDKVFDYKDNKSSERLWSHIYINYISN